MVSKELEYFRAIIQANMEPLAKVTQVSPMPSLEKKLGNKIWLKREDQQPVYSFKLRGAFHKLKQLPAQSKVVTASAGNHAQGVALSASFLGHTAKIVMPVTTPEIKVNAVRDLGGEVILHGHHFDAANSFALNLAEQEGAVFVPPFDDPDVIVGQGTIARELMQQLPQLDAVFIPVGGGGLLAGMSVYIKSLRPDIKVIGVESEESACLKAAMEAGKPVELERVGSFADGVAVKIIGKETFRLAQQFCDEVVTVTSDEICAAMQDVFVSTRAVAEPSGALALAGLKKWCIENKAKGLKLSAVLSGANLNFDRLRYVAERTALGEKNEALFAVTIGEEKGSFRRFCKALGGRAITEFNYRYANSTKAQIFVGVGLRRAQEELDELKAELTQLDYDFTDLSDNELAKLHIRYMVGGQPGQMIKERLFRFEFPEYPGALERFLDTLGANWNITLFHYRNHGAATGNVLAAFEIPDNDNQAFQEHLSRLAYGYQEETNNPCYQRFLAGPVEKLAEAG
ncbi:threonine ammonia-lyase, biosynthetic [Pseudoalteromonas tunicata]|jgi:threonine dehydratase|uniref:L-threonine dehydratase n=1 Tax=Pseudoalteromonas tunicata D2 TaxID=87626 RepID=A4C7V8_9GAMM|nr:threonine ammonia-lyase, biosynthetic [Pseudoalteromonas tunicata]ATC93179.1 threonine dehydratase [Pseudoalteromonas tunicata]AXT32246.1 threonine ammonia-lyase, biosynthetic [Pseudoalteromonas tunicata]EAR28673.1 threonine deaminase [Pseudoalteromonas tunicata D2]MDP4983389.1 threonine ammonia-lyase, biosynthetic [Pseudoalteromonas tunicata]MDP5212730.1 threonine ammonia-lyase, biosynthetic [Pseudoalteromonas tunicata]